MMPEAEIREFVDAALRDPGDRVDAIVARWLKDREEAADEARDAIYDEQRDSWNGGD